LEAEIGDGRDVLRRPAFGGLDHGADADGSGGVGHSEASARTNRRVPVRALSMAAKTIARLRMLSLPAVSGGTPVSMAVRKSARTLAWPWVFDSSGGGGTSSGTSGRWKPSSPATTWASKLSCPSQ